MPEYDYVIVGAGSAGAALAARLTEDAATTVLLLEAGPDYRAAGQPAAMQSLNPFNIIAVQAYDEYQYPGLMARRSEKQAPRLYWRGRGLGGSSAINGMIAIRAMPEDLDEWAELGCEGWAWRDVLPAFNRLEADQDYGAAAYHGAAGPIPVFRMPREQWGPVDRALRDAALDLGYGWNDDLNAPHAMGVMPYPINGRQGRRVSTNDGYLEAARDRPNLTIRGDALVDAVLFEGERAAGVRVRIGGEWAEARGREIILAAGAVHSPAILQRSGIGPRAVLEPLGIAVRRELPVGENLVDHSAIWLGLRLKPEARVADADHRHTNCCVRYSSGLAGAGKGDMFMIAHNMSGGGEVGHAKGLLLVSDFQTFSKGWLRITSAEPEADPEIELRMLSDSRDMLRLKDGLRRAWEILQHPAFREIMDGVELLLTGQELTELPEGDALDDLLLSVCSDTLHVVGTCRMGPPGDPRAVVDPDCRVIGVEGLRVIDAAVMPEVPRANTNLTAIMIGEHMAARLRQATARGR